MATLAVGPTLLDVLGRVDPKGVPYRIAEMLSKQMDILDDVPWIQANQKNKHLTSMRTGLPTAYWRSYNEGVPNSQSKTAIIEEPSAMAEARSQIDAKLAAVNGNSATWRMSEESAFVESMGQTIVDCIFNGNHGADQKKFTGLATRFSSTTAGNGQNVLLAGGSGSDNASVYVVSWGEDRCHMFFPEGSAAGLQMKDLGEQTVADANGYRYQALESLYQWDAGFALRDWQAVCRIANIDVSDWVGVTGTQATTASTNLINLLIKALARVKKGGKTAIYCNRTIQEGLMIQALKQSSNALAVQPAISQFGDSIMNLTFMGVPVRTVDALSNAETLVS